MTDPFDALHEPIRPVDPDRGFANQLRARVLIALGLPASSSRGASMPTTTDTDTTIADRPDAVPLTVPPAGAAIPYLAVGDARRAIDWYIQVFGARVVHEPIVMPDDRIGHVELELGTGLLYLADEYPEIGHVAPTSGAAAVSLVLRVPDVDATVAAAVAGGAELTRAIYEDHGHRGATLLDPFGHRWMVQTPVPTPTAEEAVPARQGDIVYASLWVDDDERAAAFFGAVLGWRTEAAPSGHARQVDGSVPHHGLMGSHTQSDLFLCFAVDDLDAALERVQAAGGRAGDPTDEPFGRVADCQDPDETPFALYQTTPEDRAEASRPSGRERPINGASHGDLAYITVETIDSARTRAFYGAVLGWEFTPGRVDDGWQVDDSAPMVGLHGGHPQVTVVPMYRVDDIGEAVEQVRGAGGTSTDPEVQPYGISAECADDQGTRFYLGQLS
jgi:predicted enzyme related to lactoylglutathione lyase